MENDPSPYQLWQIEKFGDALEQLRPEEEPENLFREAERNEQWLDDQHYFSLTEQEF